MNHVRKDPESPWLECGFEADSGEAARRLARRCRRLGAALVWQQERGVRAVWADDPPAASALDALAAEGWPPPAGSRFRAADPRQAWRRAASRPVGTDLALAPAWMGLAASPSLVVIDPLTAFGAGDHPSTLLNLELIASVLAGELGTPPLAGDWAADVGAGTGVLAVALAARGGLMVAAVDPDPAARRAVARNLDLNPLARGRVCFAQATHAALGGSFPVVAANLPGPLLLDLAPELAARTAPEGRLIVSGLRDELAGRVQEALTDQGLTPLARRSLHGWSGLALRRPPAGDFGKANLVSG